MSDGHPPLKPPQNILCEDLADKTHSLVTGDLRPVSNGDPGALLAAVLQGIKPEIGEPRHIEPRGVDAKNPAGLSEPIS